MKSNDELFKEMGYNRKERYAGEEFKNEEGIGIYFKNTQLLELSCTSSNGRIWNNSVNT